MKISNGMKKISKFLIFLLAFLILVVPAFSFAAENPPLPGLVPCDNSAAYPCDFTAFMTLINKVITFILFYMALPIAAIMIAYAGFLLITAAGGEQKTKAKNIFFNAVIGLVIAAAAWLIIRTLLLIVGYEGDWIGF